MKLYLRALSAACAVLLLIGAFAGCSETDNPPETTPAVTEGGTPSISDDPRYDKDGYLKSELPDTLDYTGKEVQILYWQDVERPEFEVEESETGLDSVKDAIYDRNIEVENRFGCKFEWVGIKGNNDHLKAFRTHVENASSNGQFYDIIAAYSRTTASLSAAGLLLDLNTVENNYLDFEKPWWPKAMLDTCSFNDALFFVSGDVSTNVLHMMYAIYYNMDMIKDLGLEDPIKLVDSKEWTIDALISMTKDVYKDNDMSSSQTNADTYGFSSNYFHLEAFYSGSGLKLLEPDNSGKGILKVSDDYTSSKTVDLVDKLAEWLAQGDTYVNPSGGKLGNDLVFAEGRCLFTQNRVYIADPQYNKGMLRNAEWEYGILPNPLYDDSQQNYITLLGNPFTLWAVMKGAKDPSMSTAVIECMASEAYRKTSPALFEMNMKYRYTPDTANKGDGARMFDIIRANVSFDLGRFFAQEMNYMSEQPMRTAMGGASWSTRTTAIMKLLENSLNKLNEGLEKAFN